MKQPNLLRLIHHLENMKVAINLAVVTGDVSEFGQSTLNTAIDEGITMAKESIKSPFRPECDCDEQTCCCVCELEKTGHRMLSPRYN